MAVTTASMAISTMDWKLLQQTIVPRRVHFEPLIAAIVESSSDLDSTEAVAELKSYLEYSDVCLMCLQSLEIELRRLKKLADSLESDVYSQRHCNAERLLLAFSFPKRLTRQDRLLLQKSEPDSDLRQHKFWSRKHEYYSILQKKLMAKTQLRKLYGKAWGRYVNTPLPVPTNERRCHLLQLLQSTVLNQLTNAIQLADFVMSSFESASHDVALCSAPCVFHLVFNYSLDYAPLFERFYALITPEGLQSPHRGKFYQQLDLVLSSTNIPKPRLAAFAKRLSAVCLLAPCHSQPMLIGMVLNLLRRHTCCQYLVHQIEAGAGTEESNGVPTRSSPFSLTASLAEAELAADGFALWELKALQRHWDLGVGHLAKKINRKLSVEEDFCDRQVAERDWEQVVGELMSESTKQAESLKEAGYASDEDIDLDMDGNKLLAGLDGWQ